MADAFFKEAPEKTAMEAPAFGSLMDSPLKRGPKACRESRRKRAENKGISDFFI